MRTIEKGDRIELVHTTDEWTNLKPGDKGTVTGIDKTPWERQINIKWDNGSTLSLLVGIDEFKKID